jgi:D-serine deaminase-like pyridoxal phosphate-dependent protein
MSENNLYRAYTEALGPKRTRALLLNQDYWQQNILEIIRRASSKNIRIATKSVRSTDLLRELLNCSAQFQGLMTYTLEETLWLRDKGFKDLLLGYPVWDLAALEKLAQNPQGITLMVDRLEHVQLLQTYAARFKTQFSVCLDLDLSMDLPRLRFGVFRSSLQETWQAKELINFLKHHSQHLQLVGLMGYEAQIAGVGDKKKPLIQFLKKLSIWQLKKRREKFVNYLKELGFKLHFVNGGGTGSLESTSLESCVTEVTVGSGFYGPKLFDGYKDFSPRPALIFCLPLVRNPKPNIYTCHGGGYVASGMMGADRLPSPYLPHGLKLLSFEGAGEVQTPLHSPAALELGAPIFFRHAKAGEICEHFHEIHIFKNKLITHTVKTYRGEGQCFL